MYDLTILIPARNEIFLNDTINDIFEKRNGRTAVIVGLDGQWGVDPIPDREGLSIIYHSESVGQRRITNEMAKLANSKYLMKLDAHCSFDDGFDVKMMSKMEEDITMVPIMRNLHAFDWVCECGYRQYQDKGSKCKQCGKKMEVEMVWIGKDNPQSTCYRFDREMHFQYWNDHGKTLQGELTETMSLQGSCFMCTRDKYFELDLCSEEFNSWGQQGVEVACKTWLSGGRVLVNRTTWYAHMFRTKGANDFGFPYPNPQSKVVENRKLSKRLFEQDNWDKAVYPFEWLIKKFNPPGWGE